MIYDLYNRPCFGQFALTESSPAQVFTELFTLQDAKEFLQVTVDDQDAQIEDMIQAARVEAERLQNRQLVRKQWDLTYPYWPCACDAIELKWPLVSVDLVQYRNSSGGYTEVDPNGGYIVDPWAQPPAILPPDGQYWPTYTPYRGSSVLIRFTAGGGTQSTWWANYGSKVKLGMKQLITHWFTERLPFEMSNVQVTEYPYEVTQLLSAGALPRRVA